MKKILIFCVCFTFFIGATAFSQRKKIENLPNFDKKPWNFGYYLGINKNSFLVDYKSPNTNNTFVEVDESFGFLVGVMVEKRLHKNFSLRFEPGLMSNVKKLYFNNEVGDFSEEKDRLREVSGTYLHMPLLLKFSADRYKNIKPYVVGGLAFDYNFSSNQNNPDDNSAGEFRMKKSNFMYELGIGIDLYLPYFKFSPSLRGIFALNNEITRDNSATSPWTAPIDNFATRGVFLKFTFE
ncbi:MAG: PorT family protein [Flavobacteriaceae bacterium]|nr:PorT family protein [Flavobacteriaceae bacterium]